MIGYTPVPWTHGVEDILLGFEPRDAGSIPAGSVTAEKKLFKSYF